MATINIYPGAPNSGTDFSGPNAAAYAALAGGTTENIVNWQAGATYTPDPSSGKWWGRDGRDGMDKRVVNQIVGGGTDPFVVLTALAYVTALTPATYTGNGIWRIDLIDNSAAIALSPDDDVFFGAQYSDTASGVEYGWRQPPAATLADVGPEGLTEQGQDIGKGVWFSRKTGNVVELHVWCPSGSSARPEVQWGGIACDLPVGGAGQVGTTPQCGPFVFMRNASNDPSGSSVTGDFRMIGVGTHVAAGIPLSGRASPTLVYGDLTYDGIRMIGGAPFALAGSTAANGGGNTGYVHDVRLTGDWEIDDRIDPDVFQSTMEDVLGAHGNDGRFENIAVESRIRDAVIEGGTVTVGLTHGVFSLVPSQYASLFTGAGTEDARTTGTVVRNVRVRGRPASVPVSIRPFAVRAMYDTVISGLDITGCGTPSKINGKRTLVEGNTIRLSAKPDETGKAPFEAQSQFAIITMSATEDANLSVKLYRNTFDRRGDTSRGMISPWAGVGLVAYTGATIPANALDAQCNVVLGDAGEASSCGLWLKEYGTGTVNRNQKWVRNYVDASCETREALNGDGTAGTAMTAAALFNTGTATGNVNDTAAAMRRRGDLPARPAMAIGVAA